MNKLKNKMIIITLMYIFVLVFQIKHLFFDIKTFSFDINIYIQLMGMLLSTALIVFLPKKNKYICFGSMLLILSFSFLYQSFLSTCVVLCYWASIICIGLFVSIIIDSYNKKDIFEIVFLGLCAEILIIAVLSLLNIYSVKRVWVFNGFIILLLFLRDWKYIFFDLFSNAKKNLESSKTNISQKIVLFVALFIFIVQIARSGIQVDYDSYWYGLRSQFVLANSTKGIYDDLGLVGFVYLYPKGAEIIMLPLNIIKSWNVFFIFHSFTIIFISLIVYKSLRYKKYNTNIAALISSIVITIPCLTSMVLTMKADVMTLLFQLMFIYFLICLYYSENIRFFWLAGGAIVASYCFKLTALLFSTTLIIASIPFVIKKVRKNNKIIEGLGYFWCGFFTLIAVWGRNVHITGAPIIAYVDFFVKKCGLKLKYPYVVLNNVNGENLSDLNELFGVIIKRIVGYFIIPTKDVHIMIAWGTVLPLFVLIITIILALKNKVKIKWVWATLIFVSSMLFAIAHVTQTDGNYLLLHYVVIVMFGGAYILSNEKKYQILLLIGMFFNVIFIPLISWGWALGFAKIGFKLNEQSKRNQVISSIRDAYGENIYSQISKPHNKYILMGNDVVELCGIQAIGESSFDISLSNPRILSDAKNFEKYLKHYNIDYLMLNDAVVEESSIELIKKLIEDGFIRDITVNNGLNSCYTLLKLNKKNKQSDEIKKQIYKDFELRRGQVYVNYGVYNDAWAESKAEICAYSTKGILQISFDEPIDLDNEIVLKIYVNDEYYTDVVLDNNHVYDNITINVNKNEYSTVRIETDADISISDGRHCCYRIWTEPQ